MVKNDSGGLIPVKINEILTPFEKIPEIKVINFQRFKDNRGYFTETYRKSQFKDILNVDFVQMNESHSKPFVIRGLHFQWNPFMGKLVRVISGQMIDLILDIRKGSPTFGKMVGYELKSFKKHDDVEWIWVPSGFAHGGIYLTETKIEYLCTGEYNPECEAGISPLAKDIDLELMSKYVLDVYNSFKNSEELIISEKDKNAFSVEEWNNREESKNFKYESN
jgi:dTDP-4-dehydrorhamnose 3,5-epimerase